MARKKKENSDKVDIEPTVVEPVAAIENSANTSNFNLSGLADKGRARVAELAEKLGRKWGRPTILPLEVAPVAGVRSLPFGIFQLDLKTGGLKIGRWNRIWGKPSTLKSTLCLKALRSAQNHCRHCKFVIVRDPVTGNKNCQCPNPRYKLSNDDDFQWLPTKAALEISHGQLPTGAKEASVRNDGKHLVLECVPPDHLSGEKKSRLVVLEETYRCEPMRCLWVDSEQSIDREWAKKNGVDTSLMALVGANWAEQAFSSIEDAVLTKEFDFIVIDSTSALDTQGNLEKSITENATVASRAQVSGRFVRRILAASFDNLAAIYRPTILATSQVSVHGIGGYGQHAHLAPTDGNVMAHALSLDIKMNEAGYDFDDTKQFAIRGNFDFEVVKAKGPEKGAKGTIKFWLREHKGHTVGDSEDLETVMLYAREYGNTATSTDDDKFIKTVGTKLIVTSRFINEGELSFNRVGDCEQFLRENPTVYDDLRARVITKARALERVE